MKALVTGGGGFLGGAIVRRLVKEGWSVRSFSRGRYPELEKLGVDCVSGDLAEAGAVRRAARGRDVIFHAAAKVGLWGRPADYDRVNVRGTENVLAACRETGVGRLVFTGSPSVVFDGRDVEGWDESAPYSRRFDSDYSRTKALSEMAVLKANGSGLAAVSLRPHLVWGPGENHIVSRIVSQGRAGKLRRIMDCDKLVDTTYVDDAVEAHLSAALRLAPGSAIAGKAYFISQGDPRPLWRVVDGILDAAGLPPVTRSVPWPLAYAAAAGLEGAYRLAGIKSEPRLTRFLVSQLSTAHWFDISAARRDLGYEPRVTLEEGMRRLKAWLSSNNKY